MLVLSLQIIHHHTISHESRPEMVDDCSSTLATKIFDSSKCQNLRLKCRELNFRTGLKAIFQWI